jgi:hypothetical protein
MSIRLGKHAFALATLPAPFIWAPENFRAFGSSPTTLLRAAHQLPRSQPDQSSIDPFAQFPELKVDAARVLQSSSLPTPKDLLQGDLHLYLAKPEVTSGPQPMPLLTPVKPKQ